MGARAASSSSVEAFALRAQALIADDQALMERLLRFTQAYDLLERNTERAQKLAQVPSRSSLLAQTVRMCLPSLLLSVC